MEKKYRLLKDLPGTEAGTIFTITKSSDLPSHAKGLEAYTPEGIICPQFIKNDVINNPGWFEEVALEIEPNMFSEEDLLDFARQYYKDALHQTAHHHASRITGSKSILKDWLKQRNK